MIENYENKLFKLNYDFKNHKKGDKIKIKTKDGVPIDRFWRGVLNDSKLDNGIELVKKFNVKEKEVK